MIDDKQVELLKRASLTPHWHLGQNGSKECLDTLERLWKVVRAAEILTGQMGTKEHPVPHYWGDAFRAIELSLYNLKVKP